MVNMVVWVIIAATFLRQTPDSIPKDDKGDAVVAWELRAASLLLLFGVVGGVSEHRLSIEVSSHDSAGVVSSKLFTSALDTAKFS